MLRMNHGSALIPQVAVPDLSGLAQLKVEYLPDHLKPREASGHKAFSLS